MPTARKAGKSPIKEMKTIVFEKEARKGAAFLSPSQPEMMGENMNCFVVENTTI